MTFSASFMELYDGMMEQNNYVVNGYVTYRPTLVNSVSNAEFLFF